jgi:hypothetical protein
MEIPNRMLHASPKPRHEGSGMIPKSGNRFSEKIMPKQKDKRRV